MVKEGVFEKSAFSQKSKRCAKRKSCYHLGRRPEKAAEALWGEACLRRSQEVSITEEHREKEENKVRAVAKEVSGGVL